MELPGTWVITNCSASRSIEPLVKVSDMPVGLTMEQALDCWIEMNNACEISTSPRELYRGLGLHQIIRMFPLVGEEHIRIVTGGQGALSLDTPIAPYDFSANPKEPHNIHNVVTKEPFVIPLWWTRINERLRGDAYPIAEILDNPDTKMVVIAVQKFFFRYLTDDIVNASAEGIEKLRIIRTAPSGGGNVPMRLRRFFIEAHGGVFNASVGNRNDTTQRAALRFLEIVAAHELEDASVEEQQEALERAYGKKPARPPSMSLKQYLETSTVKPTQDEASAGLAALRAVAEDIDKRSAKLGRSADPGEAERTIGVFLALIREYMPNAAFTTQDYYNWLVNYYRSKSQPLPDWAQSQQRASQFLAQSYARFGLEKTRVAGMSAGFYTLIKEGRSGGEGESEDMRPVEEYDEGEGNG